MALFGVEVCRATGRGDSPDAKLSRLAAVVYVLATRWLLMSLPPSLYAGLNPKREIAYQ